MYCFRFVTVFNMDQRVTIGETFLNLNLEKDVNIIDIACGTGVVADELKEHGYHNIDGLDPMKGYIEVTKQKNLYKNYFPIGVEPDKALPIQDETYDVMLCCAGFFKGLMSPKVFTELLRIVKKGGILIWNIAEGYEDFGGDFEHYDQIIDTLRAQKQWDYLIPIQKLKRIVFTDSGAAYLGGYSGVGLDAQGFIYTMKRL